MSETSPLTETPITKPEVSSWAMFRTLCGVALFSGLIIVVVYQTTLPFIQENRRLATERAIYEVLPGATQRVTFSMAEGGPQVIGEEDVVSEKFYAGFDDSGDFVGVALEGAGQGYQDVIRLLFGYDPDAEEVIGMTVLEMRETPGLGDKIAEAPHFLENFEALDMEMNDDRTAFENPIVTVKEGEKEHPWQVDGITGATISSEAVTRIIREEAKERIPYILEHLEAIKEGLS